MRYLVAAALAILFVAALDAQQPGSLDDRIDIFNVPNPLPLCGIDRPLMRLAQTARVLIGFESTPECFRNPIGVPTIAGPDDLKDVTAREVLNDLMALGPGYQWRDMGGVAVIRPAAAWSDPADPLNFRAEPFSLTDGGLMDGARGVLRFPPWLYPSTPGLPIDRPFSMMFGGGTILEAFNALILAHQSAWWLAGLHGSAPRRKLAVIMFGIPGFDHFAMETSVVRLAARD